MTPTISFEKKHRPFQKILNQRINQYFKDHSIPKTANTAMYIKTAIFLSSFFILLILIYANFLPMWGNFILCMLMSITIAGIGFNIMHDGAHGSYSRNKNINDLMGFTMNIVGGNVLIWKIKHNHLHHSFTNVEGSDQDIAHNPLFRMTSLQPKYWFHRFQHIYCFVIYGMSSFLWIYGLDMVKYFKRKVGYYLMEEMTLKEHLIFWATKIGYTLVFVVFPAQIYGWTAALIGFFSMHFVLGNILSIVFQLAHVVDNTSFEQLKGDNLSIENEWFVHQIRTTANFAVDSPFWSWYTGGLNHQVEHHLYPHICHVHYPKIRPIVKKTCEELGLKYLEQPTFLSALKSHIRQMRTAGIAPGVKEVEERATIAA